MQDGSQLSGKVIKMMPLVLIQIFKGEFKILRSYHLVTLALLRSILMMCELKNKLIGRLFNSMQWSREEMYDAVWELLCHITMASEQHYKAMNHFLWTKHEDSIKWFTNYC